VIVTVAVVGAMKVPINEVVDVVAVRDGVVPTARTMDMAVRVSVAAVPGRAAIRVSCIDFDRAFVDMIAMHRMQMSIMQVVNMAVVFDGAMPAVRAVDVTVVGVNLVVVHRGCPLLHQR
jgi:hypothetical protein